MNHAVKGFVFFRLLGAALILWALSGCASQRRVVVGLSPDLEDHYAIYPSVEFDIAAVTAEEADQIKKDGVDKYFAPGSPLRKRLEPFTVYFSQEQTVPATLYFRSDYWDRWLKKKPVTLMLIADLPHSPDMPEEDPRIITVDLKKNGIFTRPVYVEIEPEKITRVFELPKDPRTGLPAEIRRPNNREAAVRVHETSPAPESGQTPGEGESSGDGETNT
ncbi:hypothetical protein LQZ21_04675 [Treponema sp. TIM-1]|uniref:hypothetical protein n=1 Tax=Treponema sp. TIM-1 TaxID=2898417 RepID=UPI00397F9B74